MKKIPVGATIAHAYRFAFGDFFRILGVMWLTMTLLWLPSLVMQRRIATLQTQFAAHDYSGLRYIWPFMVPFYLAFLVLLFMQIVGIAKLALGVKKGPGWCYFSLGKPVWRLIGSFLFLAVLIIIGWIAVLLGSALLGLLAGLLGKMISGAVFGWIVGIFTAIAFVALWCAYFYCLVRLTFLLVPVVAAEESGFAVVRGWVLGLGNFWRMFVILLATMGPFVLLEFILVFEIMFKGASFPPAQASAAQKAVFQAAMNARTLEMMNVVSHYWYITYPLGIAVMVIFYGLCTGAQCFAYRALTDGETSVPVAGD